jgi:hypothetical protein
MEKQGEAMKSEKMTEQFNKLERDINEALDKPNARLFTREFTLTDGTRVRDEFNIQTGALDRYVMPVIPIEMIRVKVTIDKEGAKIE